jgi:hypothetical protein
MSTEPNMVVVMSNVSKLKKVGLPGKKKLLIVPVQFVINGLS